MAAVAKKTAIKRTAFAQFLNVGTKEQKKWVRMGKGITDNSIAYNANVTTETYIDEDNATSNVDSLAPNVPVTQYAYKGDEVFEYVDKLRRTRATGSDAEGEVLLVYIYANKSGNTYEAELNNCSIQVDSFGGAGGQRVQIGYTILFNGDPQLGTATIADGVPTFQKAS